MFNFVFSELLLNNNQFLSGSRFKKHIFCSFFFYETTKAWDDDALLCDLVQCRKLNIGQICRFRMYRLSFWFCKLEFHLYFINSVLSVLPRWATLTNTQLSAQPQNHVSGSQLCWSYLIYSAFSAQFWCLWCSDFRSEIEPRLLVRVYFKGVISIYNNKMQLFT